MKKTKRLKLLTCLLCFVVLAATFVQAPVTAATDSSTERKGTIENGTTIYANPWDDADTSTADLYLTNEISITILETINTDGEIWYKYECSSSIAASWISSDAYPYVKASDVTLESSDGSEVAGDAISAEVSGEGLPDDNGITGTVRTSTKTLSYSDIDFTKYSYSIAEITSDNFIAAMDITLSKGNETNWQPSSEGQMAKVTLDVSDTDLEDGDMVVLTHIHNEEATQYTYVVIDSKLTFYTDSFSIYVVSQVNDTTGTKITAGDTYSMTVGEEKTFYYVFASNNNQTSLIGDVWTVEDTANVISYTVYDSSYVNGTSKAYTWKAPWITVTAKKAGKVTLYAKVYYQSQDLWGNVSYNETTESFIINVSKKSGFYIENDIAASGCLKPAWSEDTDTTEYTYQWTRSDNQIIRSEALADDGSVNVSLDRGGITNSRDPITYTVIAYNAAGEQVGTDLYQVLYGNEILNPSFETPDLTNINGTKYTHLALYNGYEGLYWKTTAPGSGNVLGLDVELVSTDNGTNSHGLQTAAAGNQFAELNAEAAGTLYQDVLTTSGATFNWSFSHAARKTNSETMYIVIGATQYAQSIVNTDNINALIQAAQKEGTIPDASKSNEGLSFSYNGGDYCIWQHTSKVSDNPRWTSISGTYTVPQGQYLTRLFFASASGSTVGNFIDAISAGEHMKYKVEYYPEGTIDNDKTETGNGTVYTNVDLENLQSYLDAGYVITKVEINGNDYSGDITKGLYITDYGESGNDDYPIVVKITLRKKAITVRKNVTIEGWDQLSDTERTELVNGYTATFELYDANNQVKGTTTLTVANVASDGTVSVLGEFSNASNLAYGTYTVKETSYTDLERYTLDSTEYNVGGTSTKDYATVTLSSSSPTASVTCTNNYNISVADLTITKSGVEDVDHHAGSDTNKEERQSTIFKVTGPNGYSQEVVICGNDSITIRDLPLGNYTVTEKTDWSWRYTPTSTQEIITLRADGATVTFANGRKQSLWLNGGAYCENTFDSIGGGTN